MDINEMRQKYGSGRFAHLSDEQKKVIHEIVKRDAKKYQKLGEAMLKPVSKYLKKEAKGKSK